MAQISVEVRDITVLGINSGYGHLYFVFESDEGEESIISAGPAGFFPFFGDLDVYSGAPTSDERDGNGDPSDKVKGVKVLDFGERDLEDVWSLLVQHGNQVDAQGLSYVLLDQNSNSTVASLLHMAGIEVSPAIPESDLDLPGLGNLLVFDYTLVGTDSGDVIHGVGGDDTFTGQSGDDLLVGTLGDDLLYGGSGADSLDGGSGSDSLFGDDEADRLKGGSGSDTAFGGDGNDIIIVDTASDLIFEASGEGDRDLVRSNASFFELPFLTSDNDFERASLNAKAGAATLLGNEHDNTLLGNAFDNSLSGGSGDDFLKAFSGDDTLSGGSGLDKLRGQSGDDWLGLDGQDIGFGGVGQDSFEITDPAGAGVAIKDFSGLQFAAGTGESDLVVFAHAPVSGSFDYRGEAAFLADGNSQARFVSDGKIRIDNEGDGVGDFTLRISNLSLAGQLTASDFLWV